MKKILTTISAVFALLIYPAFIAFADDETLQLHKEAHYDYATKTGEITLESYVPGEMKVVQEAKAIDAILVFDFSGSMVTEKYTGSGTFTKIVPDKMYNSTNLYRTDGKKYYPLGPESTQKKTRDEQVYDKEHNPIKITYKGTQYYLYVIHTIDPNWAPSQGSSSTNMSRSWAYINVDGKRVFVRQDGSTIEEQGSTTVTYSTFPKGVDNFYITPAQLDERTIYTTFKEQTGNPIDTRLAALQKAAGDFIDMVAEHAKNTGKKDRVAVVEFQAANTDYYPKIFGSSADYINPTSKNYLMEFPTDMKASSLTSDIRDNGVEGYSFVCKRFVDLASQDAVPILKYSFSNIKAKGSTPVHNGLELAKELMTSCGRTGDDVARYVIVFTDGEPTDPSSTSVWTSGGGPDKAVSFAYELKNSTTVKSTVYSIYCNSKSISEKGGQFLDHLSSNYPSARKYNDSTTKLDVDKAKYYKNSSDKLSDVFDAIGSEILVEVDEKYDVNTTMRDFINNNYFKLPENTTKSEIHVYENPLEQYNKDAATPEGKYIFSSTMKELTEADGIRVIVRKGNPSATVETEKNDQVIVYGFNYSANWCGWDTQSNKIHGSRLVVKLPFVFVTQMEVFSQIPTNGDDSGVYPVEKNEDGTPKTVTDPETGEEVPVPSTTDSTHYNMPRITFCTLTVTRKNLDEGETAIYKVVDEKGNFIANIPLGGQKGNVDVSKSLYGLPGELGHSFTVSETGWNWAYDKTGKTYETKPVEKVTTTEGTDRYFVDFVFEGVHKTTTDLSKPEETHNHDEDFATNKLKPLP